MVTIKVGDIIDALAPYAHRDVKEISISVTKGTPALGGDISSVKFTVVGFFDELLDDIEARAKNREAGRGRR